MTTDANVAEPPPSNSTPPPNPNPISFVDAVKANDHFKKTGERIDLTKNGADPSPSPAPTKKEPVAKDATPPPAADKKTSLDPAKPEGRGLQSIKPKPEPAKKEEPAADLTKKDLTPEQKQQKAWEELKAFKEKYGDLPTKHEQTAKELEALRAKEQEWSTKQKEFETWQKERDMRDFTKSDKYRAEIQIPFSKVEEGAWHIAVAAVAKDGAAQEEVEAAAEPLARNLMKALNNPNPILRERAVKAILEQADNPIPDGVLANFIGKGETLQELNMKFAEMERTAKLQLAEHETMQKAEKLKADTEARQILEQAYESVSEILTVQASDVITPEMVKNAREEYSKLESDMKPLDTAFGNLSHGLVPQLIQKVRDLMNDNAAKDEEIKAMGESRLGIKPTGDTGSPPPAPDLKEAIAAHRQGGYRM